MDYARKEEWGVKIENRNSLVSFLRKQGFESKYAKDRSSKWKKKSIVSKGWLHGQMEKSTGADLDEWTSILLTLRRGG